MLKALLKKQFQELISGFLISGKTGKKRTAAALFGFGALLLYAFAAFVFLFWELSGTLCLPLVQSGLAWVYFALAGTIATALGTVITLFSAFTKLYKAKDNDLLLSMPVPAWMIVFSRIVGLYAMAFLFEALVFAPVIVRYFTVVGIGAVSLFACLIVMLFLPLLAVSISCLLGFFISLISVELPAKNLMTTLFSIVFLGLYFWGYSKINSAMQYVLTHGEKVGGAIRKWLFPFWKIGLACEGRGAALLWAMLIFIGTFALVYLLISKTFVYVATRKGKVARVRYRGELRKSRSALFALLRKDCLRLLKNPMLFLNCAMGSLLLFVLPIVAAFNGDMIRRLVEMLNGKETLVLAAALGLLCSTNIFTSSSVSLEGESLWIVRSTPVKTETVFRAKILLQIVLTALPTLVCGIVVGIIAKISTWGLLLGLFVTLCACLAFALLGLCVNLKFPSLHWTNELVPVKQGVAALISMFSNFGIVLLFIGGYFLFGKYLTATGYLWICCCVVIASIIGLLIWLKKRGVKLFEEL